MPICNICGCQNFVAGPGGRMSSTGKPPKCQNCFSLERHRSLRQVYLKLNKFIPFKSLSALQISPDKAIQLEWFASLEVSSYGSSNSIDIQKIDRGDKSYDIVVCNHVLEHVKDDDKALKELMRITSDRGFLQLGVPDPCRLQKTKDWGYPDEKQHGHFRLYGSDIQAKFQQVFPPDVHQLKVLIDDPVTAMTDLYFFFTRSEFIASVIREDLNP
jgi:SAM-dependent methyltransferase